MREDAMKAGQSFLLFLLLAIPHFTEAQQKNSSAPEWRESQKTDALREITYTQFTLAGRYLNPPQNGTLKRPLLGVDCSPDQHSRGSKGKFLEAYLLVGTVLDVKYIEPDEIKSGISYFPKVQVRIQFDEGKLREDLQNPGADKTSVSFPKPSLKEALRSHTVVITVDENRAGEVVMKFEIPDSTQVAEACGVAEHKK